MRSAKRCDQVKLVRSLFDRWIIVPAAQEREAGLAWSGSRWMPIGGPVQVCNFGTHSQAAGYATSLGFEVVEFFTPQEWDALPESDKHAAARRILQKVFGLPVNDERQRIIEDVLNKLYGQEAKQGP
jgi:hypothetical protein